MKIKIGRIPNQIRLCIVETAGIFRVNNDFFIKTSESSKDTDGKIIRTCVNLEKGSVHLYNDETKVELVEAELHVNVEFK